VEIEWRYFMDFEKLGVEEKVQKREEKYKTWVLEYRNHVEEKRIQINEWLCVGDEESMHKLLELFHDSSFIINYREVNDIAYMMTAVGIYEQELQEGVKETIFQKFIQIQTIKEYLMEIKFLIWRIEFMVTPNAQEELFEFISQTRTSVQTILYMVHISGMDKFALLTNLAGLFLDHGNTIYAFKILKYANEVKPGEEIILCFMAQICMENNQKKAAADCLRQILHPTQIAESMGKSCGENDLHRMSVKTVEAISDTKCQENKIAFITCVNDEAAYEECKYFLHRLEIPKGYQIEIIPVYGAKSMTSGYNAAMKKTNAKYKVYLHQDVFILEEKFLYYILHTFLEDETVGMVGICGTQEIPEDGIFYKVWNRGSFYSNEDIITKNMGKYSYKYPENLQAVAVDGLCISTQYDLSWREKEFDGWDFYDVSQCFEFQKEGYKVVIPYQEHIWCLHDSDYAKLNHYAKYRNILSQVYQPTLPEFVPAKEIIFDKDGYEKGLEYIKSFEQMFQKDKKKAFEQIWEVEPRQVSNRQFFYVKAAAHIFEEETKFGEGDFLSGCHTFLDIVHKYKELEYFIRRMEYPTEDKLNGLEEKIKRNEVSLPAILNILFEKGIEKKRVVSNLLIIYKNLDMQKQVTVLKKLMEAESYE